MNTALYIARFDRVAAGLSRAASQNFNLSRLSQFYVLSLFCQNMQISPIPSPPPFFLPPPLHLFPSTFNLLGIRKKIVVSLIRLTSRIRAN